MAKGGVVNGLFGATAFGYRDELNRVMRREFHALEKLAYLVDEGDTECWNLVCQRDMSGSRETKGQRER